MDNISLLEQWCKLDFCNIFYNSSRDGTKFNGINEQMNLYFIVIDSNNNVFGNFDSLNGGYNKNIFLFTLNNNNRCGTKKFKPKNNTDIYSYISNGKDNDCKYYKCSCSRNNSDWYGVNSLQENGGVLQYIQNIFEDVKPTDLTGYDCNEVFNFTPVRMIIIKMKMN